MGAPWLEEGGTGVLRMVEIISCKIFSLSREEQTLESLQSAGTKNYRLEEVPRDQVELADGDALVPVAHFSKEVFSTFGSPFLVLMRQGDTVGRVKERMQERLGVNDKERRSELSLVSRARAWSGTSTEWPLCCKGSLIMWRRTTK